jgi:putative transposase
VGLNISNQKLSFLEDWYWESFFGSWRLSYFPRKTPSKKLSSRPNKSYITPKTAMIIVTPKERQRLLKFGAKLGKPIRALVTIVVPSTFLRWIREDKRAKQQGTKPSKRGRPRTKEQIRKLIIRMAKENAWGYLRIVGEMKKLGIHSIKKSTVKNILKAAGLDPCPQRAGSTWDEFLQHHAASLWQCDFFSQKVLTTTGFREVFVLVFLHVATRRVILSPATLYPNEAWVTEQADSFVNQARSQGLRVRYTQRDRDGKFAGFDSTLKRKRVKVLKSAVRAPNSRAYVERFIGTIRRECLYHFIFFGLTHLDNVMKTWLGFYHQLCPHQGLENELLLKPK